MKKKNLVLLLLFPFVVALLGIVSINLTFNLIDNDILDIRWDYKDTEAFKVNEEFKLEATGVNQNKYPAGAGNQLVWSVQNKDANDATKYAEIIQKSNGDYYLKTLEVGEVTITCANQKGNVSKKFSAIIYENGVILANPVIKGSQNNIDSMIYYGEYDLVNQQKQKAEIAYQIETIPVELQSLLKIKDCSDNITFSLSDETIQVHDAGQAYVTLGYEDTSLANDVTIQFMVVDEGVNVYTYQDLLYCTNQSEEGEIVVLRKSFESIENALDSSGNKVENNIEVFGTYHQNSDTYDFAKEVYRFETTYNQEYIQQWNEFASTHSDYQPITNEAIVALHIQKDFYGNGYTLNFHNLTYPYDEKQVTDSSGNTQYVPALREDNLFRGPLPFYSLGDPNNMPLITALGQDNIGMYVHGNQITINDVYVKNCDFGNNLANLDYVGTVMEIDGDGITVQNSRLSNGKNVLRSFSSMDLLIDNCLLSYSRNFLIMTGANEYEKIQDNQQKTFSLLDQSTMSTSIQEFLNRDSTSNVMGNAILNQYLQANFNDIESIKKALLSIQEALNDTQLVQNQYKGSMEIRDTYFYTSGIASIALESLFNGPYLYSNAPSIIGDLFAAANEAFTKPIVPLEPSNISGISYPVMVKLTGKTTFYDYKRTDQLDISGLISENLSSWANSMDYDVHIDIDDIFPLKSLLYQAANTYLYDTIEEEQTYQYINVPIAYYGGGTNLSVVDSSELITKDHLTNEVRVNLLDNYLQLPPGEGTIQIVKNMILKTVTVVTGFEPFKFILLDGKDGYLFNETPQISDLIENAKGDLQ